MLKTWYSRHSKPGRRTAQPIYLHQRIAAKRYVSVCMLPAEPPSDCLLVANLIRASQPSKHTAEPNSGLRGQTHEQFAWNITRRSHALDH